MATNLINDMINPGNPKYYTRGFYNTVEDHLSYLQDPGNGSPYVVTGMEAYRYKGRFYAFLRDVIKISTPQHYYPILRANNMTAPTEFDEKYSSLIIPKVEVIENLMEKWLASMPS